MKLKLNQKERQFEVKNGFFVKDFTDKDGHHNIFKVLRTNYDKKFNPLSDQYFLKKASQGEIHLFLSFTPKLWHDVFTSNLRFIRAVIQQYNRIYSLWKMKIIANAKSKAEGNRKVWVLTDWNGKLKAVNRREIKYFKRKGILSKEVNFLHLDKDAVYVTTKTN